MSKAEFGQRELDFGNKNIVKATFLSYGADDTKDVEPDHLLAQVTVVDGGHGDCNIIDICQVAPNQMGNFRLVTDSPWRRVLIDTGYHKAGDVVLYALAAALRERAAPCYEPPLSGEPPKNPQLLPMDEMQITHFDADHVGNAGTVLDLLQIDKQKKDHPNTYDVWEAIRNPLPYSCAVTYVDVPAVWPKLTVEFKGAEKVNDKGLLKSWDVTFSISGLKEWIEKMSGVKYAVESWAVWYCSKIEREAADKDLKSKDYKDPPKVQLTADPGKPHKLTIRWSDGQIRTYGNPKQDPTLESTLRLGLSLIDQVKADIGEEAVWRLRYDFQFKSAHIYDWAECAVKRKNLEEEKSSKKKDVDAIMNKHPPGPPVNADPKFVDLKNKPLDFKEQPACPYKRLYGNMLREIASRKHIFHTQEPGPTIAMRIFSKGKTAEPYDVQYVVSPDVALQKDLRRYLFSETLFTAEEEGGPGAELDLRNVVLNRASIVTIFSRPPGDLPKSYGGTTSGFRMMFTGDAYDQGCDIRRTVSGWGQKETEPMWLSVLKVPHHGSSLTTYGDFYELVRAEVYIISADHLGHTSANPRFSSLRAIVEGFHVDRPGGKGKRPSGEPFRIFLSSHRAEKDEDNPDKDKPDTKVVRPSAVQKILNSKQYRPNPEKYNYEVWRLKPEANQRQIRGTKFSTQPFGSIVFYRDKDGAMREFFNREVEWEQLKTTVP